MGETKITAEAGKQEIILTRSFDAPRDLVFRVMNDPEKMPQWWGPAYLTTKVERMDVRNGGSWRILQYDRKGSEHAFHGVYHEVKAPERVVYTFEYEGAPGHVLLETITLEEVDGKTVLRDLSVFQAVEDRDAMLGAGMESGSIESMDRLEALLADVAATA